MKIHFVCRGNTYRSRLAEAYFNSLVIPDCFAVSSGIAALRNLNGPITTYAARIIAAHGFTQYGKIGWTQSTKEDLEAADIVVFMNADVYRDCCAIIGPVMQRFYVWSVEDVTPEEFDVNTIEGLADAAFAEIVNDTNALVEVLLGEK
ncbi:MAG: hypothetical protein A2845_04610 [Candidatus Lloydbacteria bacterium RIFCSPHIGHO2_01_FULL_49_22]|uniref:Rhodanese domain-containing protein n=1 Tax=Candidatus Lloydbacteria bacterium RIFCSPHIGHO2_01_FULL_49_22 TaxID=1798658 RepID=A0A1G2CW63_9BACT|nr:MAG: hypothetical protein A2845_04610 [Candidatus Lloydbacteria bacterium RIFCSPHIGHO2_01_FULL_49_22]OGZ10099.1 MAG: hypothetical protein A3C14_00645 [Candidatus Lloydbacteria bacterium RIFCSPHIGHO2_02_FULL_50_18]